MADEATPIDATNSDPATPMDVSVTTASPTSTTPPSDAPADPLAAASLLGDTPADAKPADAEPAPAEPATPDAAALIGAPDGDYELTLPEGATIDKDALAAVTPLAKELNLSNVGLAKLATDAMPIVQKQVMAGVIDQVTAQRTAWDRETRSAVEGGKDAAGADVARDPVYGGKPMADVLVTSAKALDRFGGADFREFLKDTGLGNHPAMMRFAYQAGSLISEDTQFERAGGTPNTPRSREDKYYPKT